MTGLPLARPPIDQQSRTRRRTAGQRRQSHRKQDRASWAEPRSSVAKRQWRNGGTASISAALGVSFQEVVHSDGTEETGVTKLQHSPEGPNEHPQECPSHAAASRGDGAGGPLSDRKDRKDRRQDAQAHPCPA
ncbi:hypothetical protein MESS4_750147 [Mesorhizobium sp. STM 4661]|nr:hypothetical protein MESS4_750147 [Mesorhizobium sp. STM 4661]